MWNQLIRKLRETKLENPKIFYGLLAIVASIAIFIFYLIGLVLQLTKHVTDFNYKKSYNLFTCLKYSLLSKEGWIIFLFVVAIIIVALLLLVPRPNIYNPAVETDERGVTRKEKATYGSARRMTPEEAEEVFKVGSIRKVDGFVFGQFGHKGEMVCAMKARPWDNRNVLIVASAGRGKTFCLFRTNIIQAALANESFWVMDPKGELFADLYLYLKEQGYTVRLWNLLEPERSDSWDCLGECFDMEGDIDRQRVREFVSLIMSNTASKDGKDDEFWTGKERTVLSMQVNFVLERYMNYVNGEYKKLIPQALRKFHYLSEYQLPNLYAAFTTWHYNTLLQDASWEMWAERIDTELRSKTIEGIGLTAEDVVDYMLRIKHALSDKQKNAVRTELINRIIDAFQDKEAKDFSPHAVEIYIKHIAYSSEGGWNFTPQNIKRWISGGLDKSTRLQKRNILKELLLALGTTEQDVKEAIETIEYGENTPKCTLTEVYHRIKNKDISGFSELNDKSVAKMNYKAYSSDQSEQVRSGGWNIGSKLDFLDNPDLRRITSNRDINFTKMGEEKTAVFVRVSDKTDNDRALAAIFFSFMIKDLSDAYDKSRDQDKKLTVTGFMDEFRNCGFMPIIPVAIASIRSRRIGLVIALQNLGQLAIYGDDGANTIKGNCDYLVFMGCNDMETAKELSEMAGIMTGEASSERRHDNSLGVEARFRDRTGTLADVRRELYTPDEFRRLAKGETILIAAGQNPLQLNNFGWNLHPESNDGNLPIKMATEYTLTTVKYPYYDSCIDSLMAEDRSVREKKGRLLANMQISGMIETAAHIGMEAEDATEEIPTVATEPDDSFEAEPAQSARCGRKTGKLI